MSAQRRGSGRDAAVHAGKPASAVSLLPWILLAAGLLLALAVRVRLLDLPLERDEGEYAYAGQLILEGRTPYGDMDNMKLPGAYYAYALIMAVLGQTARGIHLGLALWTTASALLLFAIGRRLFDPLAGAIAAASFAMLSLSPSCLGLAAHATHFVVLPALAGCWGILWPGRRERWSLALAGLAFGVAFLMKQQAAALMLFGLLFVVFRSRREGPRALASKAALFSAGAVAPYAALCLYLAAAGVFANFWFWTVTYARDYVSGVGLYDGARYLLEHMVETVGPNVAIWALAVAGAVRFFLRRGGDDAKLFLAGLAVFSFLAVCPGFYFRQHYFIVTFPVLGLFAGAGLAPVPADPPKRRHGGGARTAWALAAVAAVAVSAAWQASPLFALDATELSRKLYEHNPFPEAVEVARYIAANTSPADRIAVLGSEPEIYFYAHRRSAARYVYAYALMGAGPLATKLQEQVIRELEAARPSYVVMVRVTASWLRNRNSDDHFLRWMDSYVPEHYKVAGIVELPQDGPTRYLWGSDVALSDHGVPDTIFVLRRRE